VICETVSRRVLCGKRSQSPIDLDSGHVHAANARQEAKPGHARARADIEHAFPRPSRDGRRQEHRIASRPMPATRLDHADAAAEEVVG
jgi:hypothetical protein